MEQELMDILTDLRPDVDFETETALIDDHILESFDIVSLVAALNDAFDIEIGAKDLVPGELQLRQESAGHGAAPAGRGLMDRTALKTAAAKYGTPLYLFDLDAFTARAEKVRAAFRLSRAALLLHEGKPLRAARPAGRVPLGGGLLPGRADDLRKARHRARAHPLLRREQGRGRCRARRRAGGRPAHG